MWRRKSKFTQKKYSVHLSVGFLRRTFFVHWSYWIHNNDAEDKPAHSCTGFFMLRWTFWYSAAATGGGIGACDPRQFSFQPDSYQQDSYQDPSSSTEVQSWINLESISRSSVTPAAADLRVWHWKDNHLKGKQQYTVYLVRGTKLLHLQFQPSRVALFS